MGEYGIALDLGTSGFRAQAVDLNAKKVISTAITLGHPLPGANVMDHLHFALMIGEEVAHNLVIGAINKIISMLDIDLNKVTTLAVSGNPCQLSIFQNIEIRDLAYAGKHALERYNVVPPKRDSNIVNAGKLGILVNDKAEVLIPPAVRHEIGADSLAMMVKTNFLKEKVALVIDFGTNAQMALKVGDRIYTGSSAAGPAIEGQGLEKGLLASPGAISDIDVVEGTQARCFVLSEDLIPLQGDLVDTSSERVMESGEMHGRALGITGTGTIATIAEGLKKGLISLPKIKTPDGRIHLQDGVYVTEKDLYEAGKAIGAFRAGQFSLIEESGSAPEDVKAIYMAGASGFYVDPAKSRIAGQILPSISRVYQVGNTSLSLSRDLVTDPGMLDRLQSMARDLRTTHVMLASSKVFEQTYVCEISYWRDGMPLNMYSDWLKSYGYHQLPNYAEDFQSTRLYKRDIPILGEKGLRVLKDVGVRLIGIFEGCNGCEKCVVACTNGAIEIQKGDMFIISVRTDRCDGMSCTKCRRVCPENVFDFKKLKEIKIIY